MGLSASDADLSEIGEAGRTPLSSRVRKHWLPIAAIGLVMLLGLGVFAKNGWLPKTDALSGKRTGWFGKELTKNAPSSWNPLAMPTATPTPQLSKEYIYAGSRLLAVEDANANASPPADLAVWRPGDGTWWVLGGPGSAYTVYPWGLSVDTPVPGDYDGDGKTDFAIFRPSDGGWYYVRSSDGAAVSVAWGLSTDIPVVADYDGDGKSDIAVYRPSDGGWYLIYSSGGYGSFQYGVASDIPVPADFDGDGKADLCVWRGVTGSGNHTFYSWSVTNNTYGGATFGSSGDRPVIGDYDGDGKANYALLSGTSWIIMNAAGTSTSTTSWGQSGDTPVQNDYDGDGKTDIAVWHAPGCSAEWSIKQSATGTTRTEYLGCTGDIPVPAYYRR
jgi:hypothetical protein